MSSPLGTLVDGRYRLEAVLGSGGMSTVYRALDTVLERAVAVKLMHREIARDGGQLERFRREARAVARLNHPHIVQVIDAGEDGDPSRPAPYIVFEYVEGETLKARIRRLGRLPVPEAIAYAIEIARALDAAHERNIVHRDVKPQNVLIDLEGSAKVTDFGIARSLDDVGLTADGRVLGTTDYVSPEQALGHPVTGQSDLYSLGVVLYEMLVGDVPFHGENQVAVAMRHVREEVPDLQARRPEVSAALAAVLDRATAKDLAVRYPDAPGLIADLEDVLAIESARGGQITGEAEAVIRTLPPRARRRLPLRLRRPPAAVLALMALVGTAAAVAVIVLGVDRAQRGVSPPRDVEPPAGAALVRVPQRAAQDYDPFGDEREHGDEADNVIDGDRGTFWSTETYRSALSQQKPGVGIYVDARPGVAATGLEVASATPGWSGAIYASNQVGTFPDGWRRVADIDGAGRRERVAFDTDGRRFRYYLTWIEALPDGEDAARLGEVVLFARQKR
ncbi:MAG: protein kinase [Actinomycetota bacterium]|nr:protein kinase [Actinomycetota bacterium]